MDVTQQKEENIENTNITDTLGIINKEAIVNRKGHQLSSTCTFK